MPPIITSLQNERVKAVARLRDRKGRERQRRFVIDGAREIQRAVASGIELTELFVCPELCRTAAARAILALVDESWEPNKSRESNAPWAPNESGPRAASPIAAVVSEVSRAVLEKLAFGDRAEGLVAVARPPDVSLSSLELGAAPLIGVIEGVEKPGNVGAVLRSADGAGLTAVVLCDGETDLYNPNAIRASVGTIFTQQVCAASSADVRRWLTERGVRLFAARVDGGIPYWQADFRGPTAIVLGAEDRGLSDQWSGTDVTTIQLPMRGAADSLNVSATAAILFYEAIRQRTAADH